MPRAGSFITVLLAAAACNHAGPSPGGGRLLAVLPLDLGHAKGMIDADAQASVEEMLRDVATDSLASSGWTILNNQTMLRLLEDNGIDPTKCGDEECHLSSARELKVDKFIGGSIQFVEGEFTASIRIVDTFTGRTLADERVEGTSIRSLRKRVECQAPAFFARAGMIPADAVAPTLRCEVTPENIPTPVPHVKKRSVVETFGHLSVTTKPADGAKLTVIGPSGKSWTVAAPYDNTKAEPGRWIVTASAPGYEEQEQTADVEAEGAKSLRFHLQRLGSLSVTGQPTDAEVEVSGPDGFNEVGGLPWSRTGLKHGSYFVKVARSGFVDHLESAEVFSGRRTHLEVNLERQGRAIVLNDDVPRRVQPSVSPGISPLITTLPCQGPGSWYGVCQATRTSSNDAVFHGDSSRSYDLTVRIRGVVEQQVYTGGVANGYFSRGGNGLGQGWNKWYLKAASSPTFYFLNNGGNDQEYCIGVDYQATIRVRGNDTITLAADSGDNVSLRNLSPQRGPAVTVGGVDAVSQPFDGQFIQVDFESATPAD